MDDLEDVTFESVQILNKHGRRLDAAEALGQSQRLRLQRLADALKRLRARVVGRAKSRRRRDS